VVVPDVLRSQPASRQAAMEAAISVRCIDIGVLQVG
jgi:hypothetical protein